MTDLSASPTAPLPGLETAPAAEGGIRLRLGAGAPGLERLAAAFDGRAFAPHRHDTYAIGITTHGVQSFRYRGTRRACLAGQMHVLHPDELHDGAAGTPDGFGYRIVYVDPALILAALDGRPLPFVADPVVTAAAIDPVLRQGLVDLDVPLGDLEIVELVTGLADMLGRLDRSASPRGTGGRLPVEALEQVRRLIADDPATRHAAAALEAVSGLDRWTLARQFRRAFGTSPSRYRTMRQLDLVRAAMQRGLALSEAALDAGFADQSHMSRAFKRGYGLTPARWAGAVAAR